MSIKSPQVPIWTKFRKLFLSMLPDCLKNSIDIQMVAYRETARCGQGIRITFEGKIILQTTDNYYLWINNEEPVNFYETWAFQKSFMEYMQQKHEKTAFSENKYFRVFSLLDRRTGIRTLKKYYPDDFLQTIIKNDNFLENIYRTRFVFENIKIDEHLVSLIRLVDNKN